MKYKILTSSENLANFIEKTKTPQYIFKSAHSS